jgi:hypothetical protein
MHPNVAAKKAQRRSLKQHLYYPSIDCFKQRNDQLNDRRIRQARSTSARANDKGDETT